MKHMFDRRSKTVPGPSAIPIPQPLSSSTNSESTEPDADQEISPTPEALELGIRHLIPNEVMDDWVSSAGTSGSIPLEDLFNFDVSHWINLYNTSAERYLAEELELCELLNRDAATADGAEVDVDEMTEDILTA